MIISIPVGVIVLANDGVGIVPVWGASVTVYVMYLWVLNSYGGTFGKIAFGLRVVSVLDGGDIGLARGLGRLIVWWLGSIPLYLGWFWMLWDDRRQTWHDQAAGSIVAKEGTWQTSPAREPVELPRGAATYPKVGVSAPIDWGIPHFREGQKHAGNGRWREAITHFDVAIGLNPKHTNAYIERGFAYAELGDAERAIADIEKAISLTHDPRTIAELEVTIKGLREGIDQRHR